MLVLSRKLNEVILIGDNISVKVLKIVDGNTVSLGVEAPQDIPIWRGEIVQAGSPLPKKVAKKKNSSCEVESTSKVQKIKTSRKIHDTAPYGSKFPFKY